MNFKQDNGYVKNTFTGKFGFISTMHPKEQRDERMKNTEIPYPQRTIRILNAIIRKMESPYSNTYEYVKNVKKKLEKELKQRRMKNERFNKRKTIERD